MKGYAMIGATTGKATLTALHQFNRIQNELNQTAEKLATGFRINHGGDDPAGLIISENLRSALATLEAESYVLQRMDMVANTAEGALAEVSNLLTDTSAMQVSMANTGAMSDAERDAIQNQIDYNLQSIDRITAGASFNGQPLFNGEVTLASGDQSLDLPVLSTGRMGETEIDGESYRLADIRSEGDLAGDYANGQAVLKNAITEIASLRGRIGSFQKNTIATRINSVNVAMENVADANSVIRDTDYAVEMVNLIRTSTLGHVSMKTLSMLNENNSRVLDLLS